MKYALFLGCTIPARGRNYEVSARKVAAELGIELVDILNFICCGFPVKTADMDAAVLLGAYNMALAQKEGLDVCTLCSSCTSALTEVVHHLSGHEEEVRKVNEKLAPTGLQYKGESKVRHFARLLYEDMEEEQIKSRFKRDLSGLRIAIHYGCHYLKPSEVYDNFDSVENPRSLDALVSLTGAKVVQYADYKKCCGGPLLPVDEKTSLSVAKQKLDHIKEAGANAICLVCPFCAVMYDSNQKGIEAQYDVTYNLPVLYLTQVLGLAMGYQGKELGMNLNVVKTKELLQSLEGEE
ncbi:MAG: CoB--CoM heterodisulfide reductase iron-sulfur subunit B family protein [Deltaproteobacteria bacterium]|nr:CoB--CoM heterodisulfide reductase iron-sulfur subunit B family protein [Deltaproteobacteria bacterium]